MGAVGEEELMQETNGCEERILVSVRLRPLNDKEISRNDVSEWECINDNTVICRNTLSVAERSLYPSAYTFDRVFSGDCSTRKVYDEAAKEVALSVVSGVNSTIFAYGQTSSGKTYTMSGITEYTIADIYNYIQKHTEREFLLKFSAIEIYNESVRDLLSLDSTPLRLLDDPERGTTVERLTEEIPRDWNHIRDLLSICEAQRQIGETSLNETSSRSHQILRLTIESSAREFLGNDKSSSLTATVNFVDLAGSERSSQLLSAGARMKEGCHINRSLLTLGTVIRKLSKGRSGHIPFRDSKLTRILQSSLGGNARTAIICTMSPARCHAEQSRNTLFFASCAKEVITNAQVNVVVSDKALVKQLQRELARLESELKSSGQTTLASNSASLIREKDLQIEKLNKELQELASERDYAKSQVKDLLKMVEEDKALTSSTKLDDYYPKLRVRSAWNLENRVMETETLTNSRILGGDSFDASHYSDGHSSEDNFIHLVEFENNYSQGKSSPQLSATIPCLVGTEQPEEIEDLSFVNSEDLCKEVRCIEMEESSVNRYLVSTMSEPSPERCSHSTTPSHIANTIASGFLVAENGEMKKRELESSILKEDNKFNNFNPFYVIPSPEKPSPWMMEKDIGSSERLMLTKSRSCKASFMRALSTENVKEIHGTPSIWFEKDFSGRPESFHKILAVLKYDAETQRLSRNCSQTSMSASRDEHKGQNSSVAETEPKQISYFESEDQLPDATKQMSNLEKKNQLLDAMVPETKPKPIEPAKNVQVVAVDPTPKWPLEFRRLQNDIIELWHACNVSLVHRTYFFLLFKGDPADSIYMEVEFRRLSLLRDMFSRGNQSVEGILTPALSMKALRRERQMLSKQMHKRLTKTERETLFVEWGIELHSHHRRLQLAHLLWNDTKDMNHISRSAAIIAKLVKYVEPNQAFKEMFGLNFTPRRAHRGSSHIWKHQNLIL